MSTRIETKVHNGTINTSNLAGLEFFHRPQKLEVRTAADTLFDEYFETALDIVKLTVLYCAADGINVYLRGSQLDRHLLELAGKDPTSLDKIISRLNMGRFARPYDISGRVIQDISFANPGGLDLRVEASPEQLLQLFSLISRTLKEKLDRMEYSEPPSISYRFNNRFRNDWDKRKPIIYSRFTYSCAIPRENEGVPIIEFALHDEQLGMPQIIENSRAQGSLTEGNVLGDVRLTFVSITTDSESDRRLPERCSNLDGIRAKVISNKKIALSSSTLIDELKSLNLMVEEITLPTMVDLSEDFFAFYEKALELKNPDTAEVLLESVIRTMRKSFTLGVGFNQEKFPQIARLLEKATSIWNLKQHSQEWLEKISQELEVCAEIDAIKTLKLLRTFNIFRFMAKDVTWCFLNRGMYKKILKELDLSMKKRKFLFTSAYPEGSYAIHAIICRFLGISPEGTPLSYGISI